MRASGIKQFFLFEENEKFNEAHGQCSVCFVCIFTEDFMVITSHLFNTPHPTHTHTHMPVIL